MSNGSKKYSTMYPLLRGNACHDMRDLKIHDMVKNTKVWISSMK